MASSLLILIIIDLFLLLYLFLGPYESFLPHTNKVDKFELARFFSQAFRPSNLFHRQYILLDLGNDESLNRSTPLPDLYPSAKALAPNGLQSCLKLRQPALRCETT